MTTRTRNYRNPLLTGSRVPGNPNLTVFADQHYHGLQAMEDYGPYCEQHLSKLYQTIMLSLREHPQTLAIRFDLRLPSYIEHADEYYHNGMIATFFKKLREKVDGNRDAAKEKNSKAHRSSLRYVWCRESTGSKPHWHCVIFVNKHAYRGLGKNDPNSDNMRNRIREAWGEAIGLDWYNSNGLPFFPANACYVLDAKPSDGFRHGEIKGLDELFYRASYLCKLDTKVFGQRTHTFGCSRI